MLLEQYWMLFDRYINNNIIIRIFSARVLNPPSTDCCIMRVYILLQIIVFLHAKSIAVLFPRFDCAVCYCIYEVCRKTEYFVHWFEQTTARVLAICLTTVPHTTPYIKHIIYKMYTTDYFTQEPPLPMVHQFPVIKTHAPDRGV